MDVRGGFSLSCCSTAPLSLKIGFFAVLIYSVDTFIVKDLLLSECKLRYLTCILNKPVNKKFC